MIDTVARIERYFKGTSQYPLLIVVPSEEYKEVLTAFSGTPKIKVSDYCVGADKEPDTGKLQEDVKRESAKFLLIGLGDYLASKSDLAKKTLLPYKDLVLQNNSRAAILLSPSMYPVVKEIYDADPRVRTRISLPKTTPAIEVVNNNALIYGIKAYLEACEKGESVGSVKTARNIHSVKVINPDNAFDELKHKFPNEFSKLSQNAGTVDRWSKLLEDLNKSKKNILQYLAIQEFASHEYIFFEYAKKNDYKSWLYFINLKINARSHDYLSLVASKSATPSDLFDVAKIAILDIAISDEQFKEFYEQRKTMLRGCSDADMSDFIPNIIRHSKDRIAYLTDNTKVEKQAVIESICEGADIKHISLTYPDLYFYLQDFHFDDQKLTDYFSMYKMCKLTNTVDNNFLKIVAEYAVSRPYNSLPARSSLISSLDDSHTILLFLDACGVEYLGYIKEVCSELKLRFTSKIARADLPTITSINKDFFNEWNDKKKISIKDLDELKHHPERGYDYDNSPYPIHLVEELGVIKTALERAKTELNTDKCRKVLIASDHGASRLAVISQNAQVSNNNCEAKSSGRYCFGEELPSANNIVTDKENKYAVIADYSRFTGSRAASVEVHGGATLEEVIVPIVEITLLDSNIKTTLEENVIEVGYKTIPTLILIITPDCENITAALDGKFYAGEKLEKSKFKITMPDLKKGKYTLDIFENQNKIASKEFTVKSKGFAERDMF